jgi:hypothetical protein
MDKETWRKAMQINGLYSNSPAAGIRESTAGLANSMVTPLNSSKDVTGGLSENGDRAQLSKLSSVLNGLENGATMMRRQVQQAMYAVRGGTYQIDPLQLSKRIVGEALGSS